MILAIGLLAVVISVPLLGGSFRGLDRTSLQAGWSIVASLVAQEVMLGLDNGWLPRTIHIASFLLAGWFVFENRALAGTGWVALGGSLNLVVVAANLGVMPASRWAWSASGAPHFAAHAFSNARPLLGASLPFLGDIVPMPAFVPGAAPFSIGDVVVLGGLLVVVHHLCGARWAVRRQGMGRLADVPRAERQPG